MLNLPIKILQTQKIETEQADITFDNIDDLVAQWDAWANVTSRHLVVIVNAASPDAVDYVGINLRFNGDGGNNYNYQYLSGIDVADSAGRASNTNNIACMNAPGTNYANAFGGGMIVIPHAFNTVDHKATISLGGAAEAVVVASAGRWASAAAITSVTIYPSAGNLAVGSTVSLGVVDEQYLVEEIEDAAADFNPTFDNIPQGEGDLAIVAFLRTDRALNRDGILHQINDDAVAANYFIQSITGDGAVTAAGVLNTNTLTLAAAARGNVGTANAFSPFVAVYSQYTKGSQPHILAATGMHDNVIAHGIVNFASCRRDSTEPINKLYLEPNTGTLFKAGSLFSLYRVPKRIIERIELTVDTPTITFDNIPQNFEALLLHVYVRTDRAGLNDAIDIELNGDAVAGNYPGQVLHGIGAAVTAARSAANQGWIEAIGDTEGVGEFGGGILILLGYAENDRHKHGVVIDGRTENRVTISSNRWESLNPITQIILTPHFGTNFMASSVFELEGILKKEGLPPTEGMIWGL